MARTIEQGVSQSEMDAYRQFCEDSNIVYDNYSQPAADNANLVANYIVEQLNVDITPQTLAQAFTQLRDKLVFYSPAQQVAKQAGIDQAQADMLVSVLSRRQLDQHYLIQDAVTVAKYISAQGWAFGPYSVDLALTNMGNTPGGSKVHWVRKLQDREKEILAQREKNRADLAEIRKTRKEQASIEVDRALRLTERGKAHRDMMNRPTETTVVGSADNTAYWKSRAENVHLDVRSWNEQSWIQKMFVMNPTKPTEIDWQATYQARRRECDVYKNRGGK